MRTEVPPIRNASYSLSTLLLVTALIAAISAVCLSQIENAAIKKSNQSMANELSMFEISDTTKIHWSEIESPSKMMWRFRVYVPPGEKMQLNYSIGPLTEGLPPPMRSFDEIIEGSEQLQTISIQIRQWTADAVKIDAFKNADFAHGCVSMAPTQFVWLHQLEEVSGSLTRAAANNLPTIANLGENVILLQETESSLQGTALGGTWQIGDPPNQFLIWLEPVK